MRTNSCRSRMIAPNRRWKTNNRGCRKKMNKSWKFMTNRKRRKTNTGKRQTIRGRMEVNKRRKVNRGRRI